MRKRFCCDDILFSFGYSHDVAVLGVLKHGKNKLGIRVFVEVSQIVQRALVHDVQNLCLCRESELFGVQLCNRFGACFNVENHFVGFRLEIVQIRLALFCRRRNDLVGFGVCLTDDSIRPQMRVGYYFFNNRFFAHKNFYAMSAALAVASRRDSVAGIMTPRRETRSAKTA